MKDIARLISEISYTASCINQMTAYGLSEVQVFVKDSAHVQNLEIEVYAKGWKANISPTYSTEVKYTTSKYRSAADIRRTLNKCLNTLRKLYRNGVVNHEGFSYTTEEIRHYSLY